VKGIQGVENSKMMCEAATKRQSFGKAKNLVCQRWTVESGGGQLMKRNKPKEERKFSNTQIVTSDE